MTHGGQYLTGHYHRNRGTPPRPSEFALQDLSSKRAATVTVVTRRLMRAPCSRLPLNFHRRKPPLSRSSNDDDDNNHPGGILPHKNAHTKQTDKERHNKWNVLAPSSAFSGLAINSQNPMIKIKSAKTVCFLRFSIAIYLHQILIKIAMYIYVVQVSSQNYRRMFCTFLFSYLACIHMLFEIFNSHIWTKYQ
jgi:hypothetical protein